MLKVIQNIKGVGIRRMKSKKLPIYCADFETTSYNQYQQEGRTRVYLWCLKSVDEKVSLLGLDLHSFFENLKSIGSEFVVYFHNLSFDGEFINWYLLENGYVYKDRNELTEKSFYSIIDESGSIYMIIVKLTDTCVVTFKCSYKLFPKSIEDIGEMVGVKKLKETHNYEEIKNYSSIDELTDEEKMYINNDVTIMCRLITYLDSIGINAITMSSSAYKNWRMDKYHLVKTQLIKDENDEINEIIRKSYRGGITKVNEKYRDVDLYDVISFDVNSLYPSVMYDNPMPVGMGKIYNSIKECISDKRYCYLVVLCIQHAEVKSGFHAFIGENAGFSYSRKYEYKNELNNVVLYLWKNEYNLFRRIYSYKGVIDKVVGYKVQFNVFKDYIDRWIGVKINAKTPAERQLAKLMLNSLYGKFGMNDNRVTKVPNGISLEGKITYNFVDTTSVYYDKKIASYITSCARVKYATMMNLCGDDYIYGDTDSLYIKGHEIPEYFKECVDDKKLGYWKYEGHYKHFRALKAKCYLKEYDNGEIDRKICGCPKKAGEMINFENFQYGLKLEGVKNVKQKCTGGIVIGKTDFTISK